MYSDTQVSVDNVFGYYYPCPELGAGGGGSQNPFHFIITGGGGGWGKGVKHPSPLVLMLISAYHLPLLLPSSRFLQITFP